MNKRSIGFSFFFFCRTRIYSASVISVVLLFEGEKEMKHWLESHTQEEKKKTSTKLSLRISLFHQFTAQRDIHKAQNQFICYISFKVQMVVAVFCYILKHQLQLLFSLVRRCCCCFAAFINPKSLTDSGAFFAPISTASV